MGGHSPPVVGDGLEGDHVVPCERAAVELERDVGAAGLGVRGEGGAGGDGAAVASLDPLARGLVHERARDRVLAALDEPGPLDPVRDGDLVRGRGLVVAVRRVGRRGVDAGQAHGLFLVL